MIAVGKRVFIAGKEVFFVGVGVEVINKCVIHAKNDPFPVQPMQKMNTKFNDF